MTDDHRDDDLPRIDGADDAVDDVGDGDAPDALDVEVEPVELDDAESVPAAAAAGAESSRQAGGDQPTSGQDEDSSDGSATSELEEAISTEISELLNPRIDELAAERDQYRDIAQRVKADFENYRKRVAAQQAAEIDRATGALAEALLPVLDAAEAAYVGHPDEVGPLINLLLAELRKQGLETIDLLGKPFDPTLAEAVAHEPDDESGDVVVAEVLRSGYTWNGRTLRPAMVRTKG